MPNRSVIARVAAAVVSISSVGFALVATLGLATSANGLVAVDRQPGGARQSVLAYHRIARRRGAVL
jgi:hypothetical protein